MLPGIVEDSLNNDPGPCVRGGCENQARCAMDELACDAFVVFVNTGRVLPPSAQLVAPPEEAVRLGDWRWRIATCNPTRATYRVAFEE